MVDEKVCCHSNSQVVSDGIIDLRWYKLFVKLLILLLFVLISTLTGDVDAKGYYRSDGTYVPVATFAGDVDVKGYYRSDGTYVPVATLTGNIDAKGYYRSDGIYVPVITLTGDVDVKGYYRSDDTYVQPHYKSTPDGNPYNNYSYPDNIDPYTGNPNTYLHRYYFKEFDRDNDLKDSSQRQIYSLQQQIKLLEMKLKLNKLKEKQFSSPTTTSRYTPSTKNKGYDEFEKEKDFMNRQFFTVRKVILGLLIVMVAVSSN